MTRRITQHDKILGHLRNNNSLTVYGGRALNAQLPLTLQRGTEDYDLYSRTPKRSAKTLEHRLEREYGDVYYVKPAMHPGTFKLMDKGEDKKRGTKDDYGVADFTKPKRKIRRHKIYGIWYADVSEREKDIRTSLRDPASAFRHDKDRADRERIRTAKNMWRLLRWG